VIVNPSHWGKFLIADKRADPSLDSALPHGDDVVRRYPSIDLATLAETAQALDAVVRALDIATTERTTPTAV